jgi:hypothetical protein
MDRIVAPSFCANDNIGFSSFDKIVQENFIHQNQRSIILSAFYRPPSLQDMTYTEKIRNDFVHLKTLTKHNSLWIAGDINLRSFSVISEYIILICWYDLRRMDRIVEPSFCVNDNIGLSSFDMIVQRAFLFLMLTLSI